MGKIPHCHRELLLSHCPCVFALDEKVQALCEQLVCWVLSSKLLSSKLGVIICALRWRVSSPPRTRGQGKGLRAKEGTRLPSRLCQL